MKSASWSGSCKDLSPESERGVVTVVLCEPSASFKILYEMPVKDELASLQTLLPEIQLTCQPCRAGCRDNRSSPTHIHLLMVLTNIEGRIPSLAGWRYESATKPNQIFSPKSRAFLDSLYFSVKFGIWIISLRGSSLPVTASKKFLSNLVMEESAPWMEDFAKVLHCSGYKFNTYRLPCEMKHEQRAAASADEGDLLLITPR